MKPTQLASQTRQLVDELVQRATAQQAALQAILRPTPDQTCTWPPTRLKEPRISNVVALFGERGTGKTTTLITALQRLSEAPQSRWKVFPRPLDLSLLPRGTPLVVGVLEGLRRLLHPDRRDELRRCAEDRYRRAERAGEEVLSTCFRGHAISHRVLARTAVGPSQHTEFLRREVGERLGLPEKVCAWLGLEAQLHDADGFVLALDDVDLAPAAKNDHLIWPMLDELHQPRLLLLLAADRRRFVDSLATSQLLHDDQETADELVYKVIQYRSEVNLAHFGIEAALAFKPINRADDKPLGALLPAPHEIPLARLLPTRPRGLENIWHMLHDARRRDDHGWLHQKLLPALAQASHASALHNLLATDRRQAWETLTWVKSGPTTPLDAERDLAELTTRPAGCPADTFLAGRWLESWLDLQDRSWASVRSWRSIPEVERRVLGAHVEFALTTLDVEELRQEDILPDPTRPIETAAPLRAWARWEDRGAGVARFGLGALIDNLSGQERPIGPNLASWLTTPPQTSLLSGPMFLPRWTRSQILLSRVLDRAPWTEYTRSGARVRPASAMLLAAGLTLGAWVQTIVEQCAPEALPSALGPLQPWMAPFRAEGADHRSVLWGDGKTREAFAVFKHQDWRKGLHGLVNGICPTTSEETTKPAAPDTHDRRQRYQVADDLWTSLDALLQSQEWSWLHQIG